MVTLAESTENSITKRQPAYKARLEAERNSFAQHLNGLSDPIRKHLEGYYSALSGTYAYADTHNNGKIVHARTYKKRIEFAEKELAQVERLLSLERGYNNLSDTKLEVVQAYLESLHREAFKYNSYITRNKKIERSVGAIRIRKSIASLEERVEGVEQRGGLSLTMRRLNEIQDGRARKADLADYVDIGALKVGPGEHIDWLDTGEEERKRKDRIEVYNQFKNNLSTAYTSAINKVSSIWSGAGKFISESARELTKGFAYATAVTSIVAAGVLYGESYHPKPATVEQSTRLSAPNQSSTSIYHPTTIFPLSKSEVEVNALAEANRVFGKEIRNENSIELARARVRASLASQSKP